MNGKRQATDFFSSRLNVDLRWLMAIVLLTIAAGARAQTAPPLPDEALAQHRAALAEANASVAQASDQAARDPLRPIYHVTAAARFINDPNGPVWFEGRYHVFFQHLPYWSEPRNRNQPMWGHASSPDLVHWRHEPIALAPGPEGSYDAGGIASGACVIDDGVPTIVYTGFNGAQVQCLATSQDGMRTWQKDPANPVIAGPPPLEGLDAGFRDPCVWREGDEWRMLVGSGFKGRGGAVLLYRSPDLHQWEFLGPLCSGMGDQCFQWECPAFFPLANGAGRSHVLIVSPLYADIPALRGAVEYAVGDYAGNRFAPGPWRPVDLGGPEVYYAPSSFEDPQGRRILWGWIMAGRPEAAQWCHSLTLPRVVTLADDQTLRFEPAPELQALRRDARTTDALRLEPGRDTVLADALGAHVEIEAEIELGTATRVELRPGRSRDGAQAFSLTYDAAEGKLVFFNREAPFRLAPDEKSLRVRLFIDGCVAEAYVNGRACFSNVLPLDVDATGLSVRATGGEATLTRWTAWQMASIWEKPVASDPAGGE